MATPTWVKMFDPTTPRSAFGGLVKLGIQSIPFGGQALSQALDAGAAAKQAARAAAAPPPAPVLPAVAQLPPAAPAAPPSRWAALVRSPLALGAAALVVVVALVLLVRRK